MAAGEPDADVLSLARDAVRQWDPRAALVALHDDAGRVRPVRAVRAALGRRLVGSQVRDPKELAVAKVVGVRDLRLGAKLGHEDLDGAHREGARAERGPNGLCDGGRRADGRLRFAQARSRVFWLENEMHT